MQFAEGKEKFIESWGKMASEWGINRTMAQVHALLLISPTSLTADEVMEQLDISRGNANMNIRALMDWELVHKQLRPGERKEFFFAEKDMWKVVTNIMTQRKKRELDPMLKVLDEVSVVEGSGPEVAEFQKVVGDIKVLSHKANQTLDLFIKADSNWFTSMFVNFMK
jgi:DNA-binding transcriptional regulator GbsR (MarR family)